MLVRVYLAYLHFGTYICHTSESEMHVALHRAPTWPPPRPALCALLHYSSFGAGARQVCPAAAEVEVARERGLQLEAGTACGVMDIHVGQMWTRGGSFSWRKQGPPEGLLPTAARAALEEAATALQAELDVAQLAGAGL